MYRGRYEGGGFGARWIRGSCHPNHFGGFGYGFGGARSDGSNGNYEDLNIPTRGRGRGGRANARPRAGRFARGSGREGENFHPSERRGAARGRPRGNPAGRGHFIESEVGASGFDRRKLDNALPMTFKKLLSLSKESPLDVLLKLTADGSLFARLDFNSQTPSNKLSECAVLIVLERAFQCNASAYRTSLQQLMNQLVKSPYLSRHMVQELGCWHLADMTESETRKTVLANLDRLLTILVAILQAGPAFLNDLTGPLSAFKVCWSKLKEQGLGDNFGATTQQKYEQLQAIEDTLQAEMRERLKEQASGSTATVSPLWEQPPDDYRRLSIVPGCEDLVIDEAPYLRPNKIQGRYNDPQHYLDVQFRLLREDFMSPLRRGIAAIRRGDTKDRQLQDIQVYRQCKISHPDVSKNGTLTHIMSFDVKPFKSVRWEDSKRLKFGALLCLSADNFKTVFICTVDDRNLRSLQEGHVTVAFDANSMGITEHCRGGRLYVAVESATYFEAYKHVLKGLQGFRVQDLPFSEHFVACETEIKPPVYLDCPDGIKADFRPLLLRRCADSNKGIMLCEYVIYALIDLSGLTPRSRSLLLSHWEKCSFCQEKRKKAENCQLGILRPEVWPTARELGLDDSQYAALQLALTKRLALIQGPPGTGKTLIGYKIAQFLLANRHIWIGSGSTDRTGHPILVVCYTNHALDQFLEGVSGFLSKGIVRVGGRCSNSALEQYLLPNVRREYHSGSRFFPTEIQDSYESTRDQAQVLSEKMKVIREELDLLKSFLIPSDILTTYMTARQQQSLFDQYRPWHVEEDNVLRQWLLDADENIAGLMECLQIVEAETSSDAPLKNDAADSAEEDSVDDYIAAEEYEERHLVMDDDLVWGGQRKNRERMLERVDALMKRYVLRVVKNGQPGLSRKEETERRRLSQLEDRRLSQLIRCNWSMTESQAASVDNVWLISNTERWRLYRYWLKCHRNHLMDKMIGYQRPYQECLQKLTEIRAREDHYVLANCKVIGMTTTGAAKHQGLLQLIRPKIVIIEEAAEVLESHIITSLSSGTEHLILIGDHKQLRPSPAVYFLAKKFNLEVSLFERLVKNGFQMATLRLQHRMRPEIADLLMPHFYQDLANHKSVNSYENVKGMTKNVFFISHSSLESDEDDLKSHINVFEAQYVTALGNYLLQQGYTPEQITILCPYTGQLFDIKRKIRSTKNPLLEKVRVTAVDNYQGEENDIILLSLVRSNDSAKVGFLSIENRVCVALSRAKVGLYVIGNMEFLAEHSDLWKRIANSADAAGCISRQLEVKCQIHGTVQIIRAAKDFEKLVPDGGCLEPCQTRMDCGHKCKQMCHPVDSEHKEIKCMEKCPRKCPSGHPCGHICWECQPECVPCPVEELKCLPCGHDKLLLCSVEPEQASCWNYCTKMLSCGHRCPARCAQPCSRQKCRVEVDKLMPCGHKMEVCCFQALDNLKCKEKVEKVIRGGCGHRVQVECSVPVEDVVCPEPCGATLQCEHTCTGTCGDCKQGLRHKSCQQPCKLILVCGHKCHGLCDQLCSQQACKAEVNKLLPCGHEVKVRCFQDLCYIKCKEKVDKVMLGGCGHRVRMKCSVPVEDVFCPEPCGATLQCAHTCTGTCGDCRQGRLHRSCQQPCERTLICGHKCASRCCDVCPPCSQACENLCMHSKYCHGAQQKGKGGAQQKGKRGAQQDRKCGDPCPPCLKPCGWICKHHTCAALCNEPCSRPRCNEPCGKTLRCGHACIGLCGETCPTICRVCKPKHAAFGNENKPDARFVILEDCSHMFEVESLDLWMDDKPENVHGVQLKVCPKCKTPIRRSYRYGNIVKRQLREIERVKEKMQVENGNRQALVKRQLQLEEKVEKAISDGQMKLLPKAAQILSNQLIQWLSQPPKRLAHQRLVRLENAINFMQSAAGIFVNLEKCRKEWRILLSPDFTARPEVDEAIQNWIQNLPSYSLPCVEKLPLSDLKSHFRLEAVLLFNWLSSNTLQFSPQMRQEFSCEITRVALACDLGTLLATPSIGIQSERVGAIVKKLYGSRPIREELAVDIRAELAALRNGCPDPGMARDWPWCSCSNGHVYANADADEASHRNECWECEVDEPEEEDITGSWVSSINWF